MKAKMYALCFLLVLVATANQAMAQVGRYFRLIGPTATKILAFRSDGTIIWTNGLPGTNYTVQTATNFLGGTNWVDYIQLPATQAVSTNQIVAFHPPSGMVLIPAGSFTMGDNLGDGTNEGWYDEIPLHIVYVSAFYMDQYDVTEALWQQVYSWATNHGYSFDDPGSVYNSDTKGPNYPVVDVNWYDAVKWCNARSEMEGRTPVYYTASSQTVVYRSGDLDISNSCVNWNGGGYRLPTEAEWEKAARGGLSGQRFPWGDTINESQANYYADPLALDPNGYSYDVNTNIGYNANFATGNYPYTSPVNYFAPNRYGLYDMAGNVWQWCWDWYDGNWYANAGATANDTRGPSSLFGLHVLRGGGWVSLASASRSAVRGGDNPGYHYYYIGFRCVRGL